MAQRSAVEPWVDSGIKLLWLAAWVELLFGRLLSRAGVFIPKNQILLQGYRLLTDAGQIAFNVALFVVIVLLAVAVWALWTEPPEHGRRGAARPVAVLVAVAALLVLAPWVGAAGAVWSLAAAVTVPVTALGLLVPALRGAPALDRLGLGLLLSAHLAWYGVTAVQLLLVAGGQGGGWAAATAVLRAGELLALLAPVALGLARLRLPAAATRRAQVAQAAAGLLLGGAVAALFLGAYGANPDMAGVLAIWSLGFTLSWPSSLYVLALVAGVWRLSFSLRAGGSERRWGFGLGLLFIAGFALQVNLQHLLVLAGYLLLAGVLVGKTDNPGS